MYYRYKNWGGDTIVRNYFEQRAYLPGGLLLIALGVNGRDAANTLCNWAKVLGDRSPGEVTVVSDRLGRLGLEQKLIPAKSRTI